MFKLPSFLFSSTYHLDEAANELQDLISIALTLRDEVMCPKVLWWIPVQEELQRMGMDF